MKRISRHAKPLALTLLVAAVGIGAWLWATRHQPPAISPDAAPPPDASPLVLAFPETIASLDPAGPLNAAEEFVVDHVFARLVRQGAQGIEGACAESWQESSDGKSLAFRLGDACTWDGDDMPVSAADFRDAILRAARTDESRGSVMAVLASAVAPKSGKGSKTAALPRVEAEGRTLTVALAVPADQALRAFLHPRFAVIRPAEAAALKGPKGPAWGKWHASGPFRAVMQDGVLALERRTPGQDPASATRMVLQAPRGDDAAVVTALRQGTIHWALPAPAAAAEDAARAPYVLNHASAGPVLTLLVNAKRAPFTEKTWRQALQTALHRRDAVTAVFADAPGVVPQLGLVPLATPVGRGTYASLFAPPFRDGDLHAARDEIKGDKAAAGPWDLVIQRDEDEALAQYVREYLKRNLGWELRVVRAAAGIDAAKALGEAHLALVPVASDAPEDARRWLETFLGDAVLGATGVPCPACALPPAKADAREEGQALRQAEDAVLATAAVIPLLQAVDVWATHKGLRDTVVRTASPRFDFTSAKLYRLPTKDKADGATRRRPAEER